MPDMPPHIKRAKELKKAIDGKANVVELDDDADDDDRDEHPVDPDFSFEPDPEDFFEDGDDEGMRLVPEPAETDARTPRPGPLRALQNGRLPGSEGLPMPKQRNVSNSAAGRDTSPSTVSAASQSRSTGKRGSSEASMYQNSSNRLGGTDLTSFRDTVITKRGTEGDKETLEASYAKAKRIRAMKTTTALKTKLDGLENSVNGMGDGILKTILLLREENERKAETRRAEEEQRRRDDAAAREARLQVEKIEAEEQRRQDKMEMEERARRDREDA
ncbi:hypothetical protein F444_21645 [Phytophthora nicotianae P1976]|uniref:Uncharacterized protein n=1 Tax=Phytophthora nicotianae P1976 TaxID=1317066 RepID=A0A080Z0G2_PHYNI|nr:hypothetical protein F444_21645 [Phytophthora nicotianae P1976]